MFSPDRDQACLPWNDTARVVQDGETGESAKGIRAMGLVVGLTRYPALEGLAWAHVSLTASS